MKKIKVTFSDGSHVIFNEEQQFQTIVQNEAGTSMSKIFKLWSHHHDHLIPSFTEMLVHGKFFFDLEKPNTIYATTSIVKIEKL